MSEETVTFNLELNTERALSEGRRLETFLYRLLGLLGRLGLPPQLDAAIAKLQRFIMVIRLAHSSLIALQAASGPIGWALAGVGIATAALSTTDFIYDSLNGR